MSFPFAESNPRNGRAAPPVPTDPSHESAPETTGSGISWFGSSPAVAAPRKLR
ncbi:hypothetical protein RCH16_000107 [Cryobacterium sp. MP_M5]|uniref:hypothetical protein n=1 Tax=unclassified Cryobacterium TaxID=2649013 RepID=UPI0018CA5C4C|nr:MULTISPECIES: hypothetical protein [unclassified Cryobacterium]MBG6056921.1 hypothetical protein [Cryobacterium sp. MP_M3]MEC5175120.1 hypothetical protein [Cryobacterium sp. MP_M5]